MNESNSQTVTVPANSVRLFLPIQLLTIINAKSGIESQLSATWILKTLTLQLKDDIVKAYGQESYDALIQKYSLTAIMQTQNNIAKKQERLEKRKRREEFEREKLELKKKELAIRQQNADSRVPEQEPLPDNKPQIEKLDKEIGYVKARMEKYKDNPEYVNPSNPVNLVTFEHDSELLSELEKQLKNELLGKDGLRKTVGLR